MTLERRIARHPYRSLGIPMGVPAYRRWKTDKSPQSKKDASNSLQKSRSATETKSKNGKTPIPGREDRMKLLALPINHRPFFPGYVGATVVKDNRVIAAIEEMVRHKQSLVGLFLVKEENHDLGMMSSLDQVHRIGTLAQITTLFPNQQLMQSKSREGITVVLHSQKRIKIIGLSHPEEEVKQESSSSKLNETASDKQQKPDPEKGSKSFVLDVGKRYGIPMAEIQTVQDAAYDLNDADIHEKSADIVAMFKQIATLNMAFREQLVNLSLSQLSSNLYGNPNRLADFAASLSTAEPWELQKVLEAIQIKKRLQSALSVLRKELTHAKLQVKISKQVDSRITPRQRESYLEEQLKNIQKELGTDTSSQDALLREFKMKAGKLAMPPTVQKVFNEELAKLASLDPAGVEFNMTRNYVDWLTQMPWGQQSVEHYDVKRAKQVLDEDHYGLKDVKDYILEFIAVCRLRKSVQGKIICLVGPPGVGKTSVGKSIARALDRRFYQFSVGGLADVAEIKGHRRTYVGAMPGKVIQALKKVHTENPLILIDEIDKVGAGYQGDPSAALLEVLDPEQNNSFVDYYLDVPVDLSRVMFICTANVVDTIPAPLRDRMEVIELSGYVEEEKMAIAEKYLVPAAKKATGLENLNVNLTKDALSTLITYYSRESGVRSLKKYIEKIFRKAALKVVQEIGEDVSLPNDAASKMLEKVSIEINSHNLKEYIGSATFPTDWMYETTPPGVAMGLIRTNTGGTCVYVEAVLESSLSLKSTPGISKTGHMDAVMQESTDISYTFVKSFMATNYPKNRFFDKARIHLNCPGIAVPKDGPSAGMTMATALLSLALCEPVNPNVAMMGELTVTGKILQVDGFKEKMVAVKRSKASILLFPEENQADWDELPEQMKEGIRGVPVSSYNTVFDICFGSLKQEDGENAWSHLLS
ncbi:ATP-dependent Lon protease pim1 [Apophysomyces ossiformis]|uniref:Lon protease homolog n=1 Tax=Apophysomyces ossiformis TaxID=679940 RepID=A0A8H7ESN1_9FUNG|nr:ATP-dependent Lon protease pim1 [Apophysomyces ossiformis]